ncbi:hypothetical protein QFC21_005439 [Naganishia friedmannii]|uniref:Uncharacterized protein n=1 Tax=Naganishia friedmannii TaxID=89922 RepID=A0ACC2VAQ7_9TREE|nr:hypothetical protein QFC21_005439 [Naganishia friedmannii]
MPSESSRRRSIQNRKENAQLFDGTPFRPAHQHGERAKRKGKRKAALDGNGDSDGSSEEDNDHSLLDELPYELLPSIFSLLPPRDLLPLKTTCHLFNRVIQSDTLWRDVYINRFVRAKPDPDVDTSEYVYGHSRRDDSARSLDWQEQDTPTTDAEVFGLTRSCVGNGSGGQGWQKEAIHREAMLERFTYSRATTVMHNPHIDIIHHFSLFHNPPTIARKPPATNNGKSPATTKVIGAKHRQLHRIENASGSGKAPQVVSVGLNAGVAIRGDPLIGRSMQGYLGPGQIPALDDVDRVPTTAYTAPVNPSCILWGLRSGIVVHSTLFNPVPTPGRLTGASVSCSFEQAHTDAVRCIYMPPQGKTQTAKSEERPVFFSGGEDGRVKMWMLDPNSKRGLCSLGGTGEITCIWSSAPLNPSRESPSTVYDEKRNPGLIDPVVQIRYDPDSGLVVAATERGNVWLWTMFMPCSTGMAAYRVFEGGYLPAGAKGTNTPMHLEFDIDPQTSHNLPTRSTLDDLQDASDRLVKARIMLHNSAESQIHRISVNLQSSGALSHVETVRLVAPGALPLYTIDTVLDTGTDMQNPIALDKVLVPADFTVRLVQTQSSSDDMENVEVESSKVGQHEGAETSAQREVNGNSSGEISGESYSQSHTPSPLTSTPAPITRSYSMPYIVAGTRDGWVIIWSWAQLAGDSNKSSTEATENQTVMPLKRWRISEGAVTSVIASRSLVATGTFDGLVQIWDPLASPPTLIRSLRNRHSAPPPVYPGLDTSASKLYSVNNIILDTDMVVASIGNQVLGWRAGSQKVKEGGKGWKGQVLGKHSAGKSSPAKGFNQTEFKEDIKQSKSDIKAEQESIRAKNELDRLAREEYAEIGLADTDEALQYALMISREQESQALAALSESKDERELREMLEQIAKLEASEASGSSGACVAMQGDRAGEGKQAQMVASHRSNASGIVTEEEELRIALEQIQAAEAREAALSAAKTDQRDGSR